MKKNTLYLALASALVMPVLAHAVANTKATVIGSSATSTNSPVGESVGMAVDGNTGSKYLNFDKLNTGLMVTLDAPRIIEALVLTTGNDAPERDPDSISIYGSNTSVTSGYTLIANQSLSLSSSRGATSQLSFTNTTAYKYYKVVFPTLRNSSQANSMQIAEVSLLYSNGAVTTYQAPAPLIQTSAPLYTPAPAPVEAPWPTPACPLPEGLIALSYPFAYTLTREAAISCKMPPMGAYNTNGLDTTKEQVFHRGNTPQGYWEVRPKGYNNCSFPNGIRPSTPTSTGVKYIATSAANLCAYPSQDQIFYDSAVYSKDPAPKGSWVKASIIGGVSIVASSSSASSPKKRLGLFSTRAAGDLNVSTSDDQTVFAANICILPDGTWIAADGTTGGWSSTEDGQLHLSGNNSSFGLSAVLDEIVKGQAMAGQVLEWDTGSPTAEQTIFQSIVTVQDTTCAGIDTEKMKAGGYVPAPTDDSAPTDSLTTDPTAPSVQ